MDILVLAGFTEKTARELNREIFRLTRVATNRHKRAWYYIKQEVNALTNPDLDLDASDCCPPRICGFYLERLHGVFDLDTENLHKLPYNAYTYLLRILRCASHLRKHMDISKIPSVYVKELLKFMGIDAYDYYNPICLDEHFDFNEEDTRHIVNGEYDLISTEPSYSDADDLVCYVDIPNKTVT